MATRKSQQTHKPITSDRAAVSPFTGEPWFLTQTAWDSRTIPGKLILSRGFSGATPRLPFPVDFSPQIENMQIPHRNSYHLPQGHHRVRSTIRSRVTRGFVPSSVTFLLVQRSRVGSPRLPSLLSLQALDPCERTIWVPGCGGRGGCGGHRTAWDDQWAGLDCMRLRAPKWHCWDFPLGLQSPTVTSRVSLSPCP